MPKSHSPIPESPTPIPNSHHEAPRPVLALWADPTPWDQESCRALGTQGCFPWLCPTVEAPLEPMSGLALFLIVFFSLVAIVFAIVIGIIIYNKWQEQSRKHFY